MERIVLTVGMRKSASTYAFQITSDLFRECSTACADEDSYPESIRHPFIPDGETFDRVLHETEPGTVTVRKTHLDPIPPIKDAIDAGECFPIVQIRDPLDIVASLIDAGKAERQKPPEFQREGFTAIRTFEDAMAVVREDISIALEWIQFAGERGFPCVDFEYVTAKPADFLKMIAARFGFREDNESILEFYRSDSSKILEFNQGEAGRGWRYLPEAIATGVESELMDFSKYLRSVKDRDCFQFGEWIFADIYDDGGS